MAGSKVVQDLHKMLSVTPKDLYQNLEYARILQKNIQHYIRINEITKQQIMKHCDISEAQFYRNMKNYKRWDIDSLIKVVELANKKVKT
jgi:hypothetical protein